MKRSPNGRKRSSPRRERTLRDLAHDVATPIAALRLSTEDLLSSGSLSEHQLAAVQRVEVATRLLADVVDDFVSPPYSPDYADPPGVETTELVDLYQICCQLADRRQQTGDRRLINCRAFGDPRGAWDRDLLLPIVSHLVSRTFAHADLAAPITLVVTGMSRHVRLDVHSLGWVGTTKRRPLLPGPAERAAALGGTLTAIVSPSTGTVFTLRLPRRSPTKRRLLAKRKKPKKRKRTGHLARP
jgi:signal transduction histidine kinase